MTSPAASAEARWNRVVAALTSSGANIGLRDGDRSKRGFGSATLTVNNKIFALLSPRQGFVVKLPRQRVDELVAAGRGERFDPGHGRLMKEWCAIRSTSTKQWQEFAREAMSFVSAK